MFANGCERGKADGPGLAGFEDGKILRRDVHTVGQIVQPHFALGENYVEIDDDGHIKRKAEWRNGTSRGARFNSSFHVKPSIPVPPVIPALPSKARRQK